MLQLTWPANTTTFDPLRALRVGDVAQLMRGANHSSPPRQASLPCSSTALFVLLHPCQEASEIMSVLIRTQALHESALALSSDTVCCSVLPRPSAKVRTSMLYTQSLAIHDSRHTAGTVSVQWGPKCHVKARRPAGTSMQRAIADTGGQVHLPCNTQTLCRMNELMLQLV